MRLNWLPKSVLCAGLLLLAPAAAAAQTANGTLTVTATVESSIALEFQTNGSGVTLTGAGTNTATLDFGTVSAYGTIATPNVTRTVTGGGSPFFSVSSPFDIEVLQANSSSPTYTLEVALAVADPTNTWRVNATTLTTANQTLGAAYSYASAIAHTLYLDVPLSAAAGGISQDIDFTATAN